MARRKNGSGYRIAASADELAAGIVARLSRQSSEIILAACFADENENKIDPAKSRAVERALKRENGVVQFSLTLDRPLIGLGASALCYYPAIASMLGAESAIPDHADVANAIGAVVGHVRVTADVFVSQPQEGLYVVNGGGISEQFTSQETALSEARDTARKTAASQARAAGADEPVITLQEEIKAPEIEGRVTFIEAHFIATATGRPRIARD